MKKLSVVLAVKNEEENLRECLESIKDIASEIIVVDEYSTDRTIEIAEKFQARIFQNEHKNNFHESKQMALQKASYDWILQLDADERVSGKLKEDIKKVLNEEVVFISARKQKLFKRHQSHLEQMTGNKYEDGDPVAYFIPRKNYFLGKPLKYAGVYPDAVIRLVQNDKGNFPARSVHEQMQISGAVGWLDGEIEHRESPTFERYLTRANRYTTLTAKKFKQKQVQKNVLVLFFYSFIKPLIVFIKLYFRHKGFKDGMRGFIWSLFSALHFPIAYFKYWTMEYNK